MKRTAPAGGLSGWRALALVWLFLPLSQAQALVKPVMRAKQLPPMQPSENIVLRDRPVVVRMPVPPDILEELQALPRKPKDYAIRLDITLPSNKATLVYGFARRWATVRTSLAHPSSVGYFVILAKTSEPDQPPRKAGGLFVMTDAQLRRAVGRRDYFPLTLVQIDDRDAEDESEYVPRRDVTLHIERIFFER